MKSGPWLLKPRIDSTNSKRRETLKGIDEAVSIAKLGIREADHGVQQVIEAQCALQGVRAVERISGMSQQMAAASRRAG